MARRSKKSEDTIELPREELEKLLVKATEFEDSFYRRIARTKNYEIVPIPLNIKLTDKLFKKIKEECKSQGLTPIYRIAYRDHTVVINPKNLNRIGMVIEGSAEEYLC